jgi:hypothetical protein
MTRDEMIVIDRKISQLKEWSKNLRVVLSDWYEISNQDAW